MYWNLIEKQEVGIVCIQPPQEAFGRRPLEGGSRRPRFPRGRHRPQPHLTDRDPFLPVVLISLDQAAVARMTLQGSPGSRARDQQHTLRHSNLGRQQSLLWMVSFYFG